MITSTATVTWMNRRQWSESIRRGYTAAGSYWLDWDFSDLRRHGYFYVRMAGLELSLQLPR